MAQASWGWGGEKEDEGMVSVLLMPLAFASRLGYMRVVILRVTNKEGNQILW